MVLYAAIVSLLLGCAAFMLLYHVNQQTIFSFDEGFYGVSAYEMAQNNDWIVNTTQWQPDYYNLKPPMSFWAIMLGYKIFGFTLFGFRFQCLFSVFLLMIVVTWWMKKRHGLVSSAVTLALLVANVIYYERTSDSDELYWLLSAVSMLFMLDSERDVRYLYGTAFFFALSFLDKSFHALIIPLICFAYLLFTGRLRLLKPKHYLLIFTFAVLPVAAWAAARYLRDGTAFFSAMISEDVVGTLAISGSPWYFYLVDLATNPAVVAAAVLGATALTHKLTKKGKPTPEQAGLLMWMILPVLVFSFFGYKLHHYIMMMMAAAAMSGGLAAGYLAKRIRAKPFQIASLAALSAAVAFMLVGNINYATHRVGQNSFQTALLDMFDRDFDGGLRVYIQKEGDSDWSQADMLCSLLSGDVLCLNGGLEAFKNDGEPAVVVISNDDENKTALTESFLEEYPVYYQTYYVTALENLN
jgi:4-amino-4-deoxy-L-arabinose transferase-like glycosyltransferase